MDTELAIRVTAEARDAVDGLGDVGAAAGQMATDVDAAAAKADNATRSLDGVAGAADNVDSKMGAAAGSLGALSGGLEAAGFPGAAAGLQGIATAADAASGAGGILNLVLESSAVVNARAKAAAVASAVATKAQAAASRVAAAGQWLLNAALSANPIGLIVAALALMVAGVILAYKKSETFRTIVDTAFGAAKTAIGKVVDVVQDVVDKVGDVIAKVPGLKTPFETAAGFIGTALDKVTGPLQAAWDLIQNIIDGLGKIPGNPFGRSASGGGLSGSLSSDLRNGTAAGVGAGGFTLVNIELNTLDVRGTALRDLVQALRRQGVTLQGAVVSS